MNLQYETINFEIFENIAIIRLNRPNSYNSLNKYSIGIEISNPGHNHIYKKFLRKQINSLTILLKYLIKKYKN